MKAITKLFSIMAAIAILTGCKQIDFKKTKGGMPYKIFSGKGGEKVEPGNFIKVHVLRRVNDSVLFNTRDQIPAYIPVTETSSPYDISELFTSLKKGDSVLTVQMIDSFIRRNPQQVPPQFKNGDQLFSTFKILDVFKTAEEYQADLQKEQNAMFNRDPKIQAQLKKDIKVITDYLARNNINAQKANSGTYVEIINPGTGEAIEKGKYVSLKYKGSNLNGKVFDSNMDSSFQHTEPLTFIVDQSPMIKGLQEGIKLLKNGAKARIYIPSSLAYGENSPFPDIQAFENLIFDIEVLDVKDKAPQPQMPEIRGDTTQRRN